MVRLVIRSFRDGEFISNGKYRMILDLDSIKKGWGFWGFLGFSGFLGSQGLSGLSGLFRLDRLDGFDR
jgi:hypothetical protein